ncbi:MAG: glycoside hydrolase family 88 protein [Ferruginibacter sp.]
MGKLYFIFCRLYIYLSQPVFAQTNYAVKLAETIMNTYKDSMVVMKYASHLEQDKQIPKGQTAEHAQKTRPAVGNYERGVVLLGFEKLAQVTGDKKYVTDTKNIIDHFITTDGGIRTYNLEGYNLDNIPAGRQLLHLYVNIKGDKYKIAAASLYNQLAWHPF